MDGSIKITNIANFARALKKVDKELPKELRKRLLVIAQAVAGTARGKMHFKHGSGRAAGTVKGRATARGASIVGGGSAVPYYPWLDFGGSVGRGHRPGVGWSGSIVRLIPDGGKFIYPAIADHRDDVVREAEQAIRDVGHDAGFDT